MVFSTGACRRFAATALVPLALTTPARAEAPSPAAIRAAVEAHIGPDTQQGAVRLWRPGDPGGVAVAVVTKGASNRTATAFFTYGCAVGTAPSAGAPCAVEREQRPPAPMASDTVIDLASVGKLFAALYVAKGVLDHGAIALTDSIADPKYRLPLTGACIKSKTVGDIVSQSSGLPDFPVRRGCPAPQGRQFDFPQFIANLNCWGNGAAACPPAQHYLYSDVGFVLLRLAISGQNNHTPFPNLVKALAADLQMTQTTMTVDPGRPPVAQGYRCVGADDEPGAASDCDGAPIVPQGEQKATWYQDRWGNGGQVWSSTKDMALLAALALDAEPSGPSAAAWAPAMLKTQAILFDGTPRVAMAWQEVVTPDATTLLDKNGGNTFTSTYIGLTADRRIAVVILTNRGGVKAAKAGQQILGRLAHESP